MTENFRTTTRYVDLAVSCYN